MKYCNSKHFIFLSVISTAFPMFDNDSRIVRRSADTLAKLLGALGISLATGNTGTGMCQRGAYEHGCEFAPVAGYCDILSEILSAPCRRYVASAIDGQYSYAVKATERQFTIKQNIHFKNFWHFSTNYFQCPSIFKIFEINSYVLFHNRLRKV